VKYVPPESDSPDSVAARPVDTALFRDVVGRFATGVLVATTRSGGVDHAMTVNAFTSVSLDPLLVLICAERISRFRDAVLDAGTWAVSVLSAEALEHAERFAVRGRPINGRLSEIPHHPGPHTALPILDQALAAVECETYAVHDGGDHDIVVGRVLGVSTPDGDAAPLIYHGGRYRRLHAD
jgi:flavin reductase (DIM6/NTAB) family NADH-FMN oxidoreductase RutF